MQNSGSADAVASGMAAGIPGLGAGMMGIGGLQSPGGVGTNSQPPTPQMTNPEGAQQFCLRWNSYPATVATQLAALRAAEDFVDVTLACDGRQLRAHKLVLSACSPYFMQLFKSTPCQHPVIFLRDVGFRQLVALLEFMYAGEVNVSQVELPALLRTAEALQVRGLADTTANNNCPPQQKPAFSPHYAPPVGQPVMPTPNPPVAVPMEQQTGGVCAQPEATPPPPTSTAGSTTKRSRNEDRTSSPVNKTSADDHDEEVENSEDSNDSHQEFEALDEDMKPYVNDESISEQLEDMGEVYTGRDVPGVDPFDITQADLGSDVVGGSQSEEESSEEDDDEDDGECKDFTYQSDASYSQETMPEPGGNSNSNGESVAGPSGTGGAGGEPGALAVVGGGSGKEPEPGQTTAPSSGGGRNRLSRSLWPPGIPYHGPQQCPYCPRILSNVGNWRKHVLTMHFAREKVYKCRHCASAFRTAEYLQKHYVRVHNYPQKMTRRKYVEQT